MSPAGWSFIDLMASRISGFELTYASNLTRSFSWAVFLFPLLDLELDLLFCLEQRFDPALEDRVADGSWLYAFLDEEHVTGKLSGIPGGGE